MLDELRGILQYVRYILDRVPTFYTFHLFITSLSQFALFTFFSSLSV